MMVLNARLLYAVFIVTVLSLEGAQWYFLPNFTHDVKGLEVRPDGEGRFSSSVPEKVKSLMEGEKLSEGQKKVLYWHPAYFPHRDFVRLMPMRKVFGWYAREFDVPEQFAGMDVLADLGVIDDSDETFVNGQLVGKSGKVPDGYAWQEDRLYRIPSAALTPFFNYMAVHVWSLWGLGGIVGPPVLKAALAPKDAQWDIAFINDAESPKGGLNAAATLEGAMSLLPANEKLTWQKASMPWNGFAQWKADAHYAVFRLEFDLKDGDGSPRRFPEEVVIDMGAVFDVAAFYLNGRRVGLLGRFPEGAAHAFTEAAQRARFIARPDDWSQDGHNSLVAIVHRERGIGGLPGAPGILLESVFDADAPFSSKTDAFYALIQSGRLDEAAKLLGRMKPSSDTERAWLLSHRAHLAFIRWLDGGRKDSGGLDAVLAPVAEILSAMPDEAPRQSAMQAFCRVLRLAEQEASVMSVVKRHFPFFSDGCIAMPPDRITKGDWMLHYGEGFRIFCGSGQINDNKGGTVACKYKLACPGKKDHPRYWLPNYQRDLSDHSALPVSLMLYASLLGKSQLSIQDVHPQMFPDGKIRRASWWDDHGEMHPFDDEGPDLLLNIENLPETEFLFSTYMMDFDWRTTAHPRQQSALVFSEDGAFLNAAWVGKTDRGVYERFMSNGRTKLKFRFCKHRGACVAVSGVFIDRFHALPPFLPSRDGVLTGQLRNFNAQRQAASGGTPQGKEGARQEDVPKDVIAAYRRLNSPKVQTCKVPESPLYGEVAKELLDLYDTARKGVWTERLEAARQLMAHEKELLSRPAGTLGLYIYTAAAEACFASHQALPSVLSRLEDLDALEALSWLSEIDGIEHCGFAWNLIATASVFEKSKEMTEGDRCEIIYRLAYANASQWSHCIKILCANNLEASSDDAARKRGSSIKQWLPMPRKIDGTVNKNQKERQK